MKKILLGIVIGMVLMIPMQAFASDIMDMIGKKVDGVFSLNVNMKDTHKKVIDIEGTSYISIRDLAELFGYDILFNETDKRVELLSKEPQPGPRMNTNIEYGSKTVAP